MNVHSGDSICMGPQVEPWSPTCLLVQETRDGGYVLGREDSLEEQMASCPSTPGLEVSTDRAAWRATVHGVAKSRPGLRAHTHTCTEKIWTVTIYLK